MRLYLVCDDDDTEVRLRLAGVDGTCVRSAEEGRAQIRCFFAGRPLQVIYQRPAEARGDRWRVKQARMNGRRWGDAIPRDALLEAPEAVIYVELEGE